MAANISIGEATESDLPVIVAVCVDGLEPDILTHFLYSKRRIESVRMQTDSLMVSLGKRFTHPTNRCYINKAVDTQTGELVGWCLVRWEDGTPFATTSNDAKPLDFATHYQQECRKNWNKIIKGEPYTIIGAVYVTPDRQGHGIGRQLIEYIYSQYNLDDERVVLQTRAMSEGFYTRLGWTTVDSTDVDLSEWGGKGQGYGLHRSPQMVRYPKGSKLEVVET